MTGLSVRGLTVRRGTRTVLEDVSFSAPAGAITAILGAPGAGKTSLLAAIAGLLTPERGAVLCGGTEVNKPSARRRRIGFLPPGTALPAARDTEAALHRIAGRRHRETVQGTLAALAPGLARQPPAVLSHGEAFLALAAARLLPEGDILLVDEAGQGLDEESWSLLAALLGAQAAAGRAVVLATRANDIARIADHLVLLAGGRVVQAGPPASLYAEPRTELAARLTGAANIFQGRIREVRAGGFAWVAEGGRYLQFVDPEMPRPALGADITLCLRPERVALLAPGEAADNAVEAEIFALRAQGGAIQIGVRSPLGDWRVTSPSWHPPVTPVIGQTVRLAWAADAAWLVA